eukprot:752969-Hanusia_phi.AAC.1
MPSPDLQQCLCKLLSSVQGAETYDGDRCALRRAGCYGARKGVDGVCWWLAVGVGWSRDGGSSGSAMKGWVILGGKHPALASSGWGIIHRVNGWGGWTTGGFLQRRFKGIEGVGVGSEIQFHQAAN